MTKVIIIEDEKPSARYLQRLLNKQQLNVVATLHAVEDAIKWFNTNPEPDLIFLDVQLSDGLSFEIFEAVTVNAPIIFTTAFDEYALKAFKLNSIDYLLKPIEEVELISAISKYKSNTKAVVDINAIKEALTPGQTYKSRLSVKVGQRIKLIQTQNIIMVSTSDKAVFVRTTDKRDYAIDYSLDEVESFLDPKLFFRVNRQYIINIEAVDDIIYYSNSRLKLQLKGTDNTVVVARERVKDFKNWLG